MKEPCPHAEPLTFLPTRWVRRLAAIMPGVWDYLAASIVDLLYSKFRKRAQRVCMHKLSPLLTMAETLASALLPARAFALAAPTPAGNRQPVTIVPPTAAAQLAFLCAQI